LAWVVLAWPWFVVVSKRHQIIPPPRLAVAAEILSTRLEWTTQAGRLAPVWVALFNHLQNECFHRSFAGRMVPQETGGMRESEQILRSPALIGLQTKHTIELVFSGIARNSWPLVSDRFSLLVIPAGHCNASPYRFTPPTVTGPNDLFCVYAR
jgi:hypothetical protein